MSRNQRLNYETDSDSEESESDYKNWEEKLDLKNKVKLNDDISCALINLDKLKLFDLWNLQRSINEERIDLLYDYYIKHFDKKDIEYRKERYLEREKSKNKMKYVFDFLRDQERELTMEEETLNEKIDNSKPIVLRFSFNNKVSLLRKEKFNLKEKEQLDDLKERKRLIGEGIQNVGEMISDMFFERH